VHSLDAVNQDLGRHIKTGQIIWETKSVPRVNTFSFTEPNAPFINHHWLAEVVFFFLSGAIGLKGLILFKVLILLAAFFLLYKALPETARGWPFLLSGLFGVFVFSSRTDVRPEIFSYLFLTFFIHAILQARQKRDYKWLYALPIVQLLWTNTHIYFILGPALLFLFLIDQIISKENKPFLKNLLWIFLITSAVTLINPNFIKGALEPLNILKNYGYSIVENQSVSFLQNYGAQLKDISLFQISIIFLIISFVIAIKNGKRKIFFEVSSALMASILAMTMIRNLGLYVIIFVPIVSLNLSTYQPKITVNFRKAAFVFYAIIIILTGLLIKSIVNNSFYIWQNTSKSFGLSVPAGMENAVRFIEQNKINGPMFNNFDIGSYLIWKLYPAPFGDCMTRNPLESVAKRCGVYPEQSVFVDGRPETYSVDFLQNVYIPMQQDPALWKKYSDQYKINYIVFGITDATPWAQTFLRSILQNTDWPLIYADENSAVFIRKTPENQKLIDKFRIK
jgi:hypothetical protein